MPFSRRPMQEISGVWTTSWRAIRSGSRRRSSWLIRSRRPSSPSVFQTLRVTTRIFMRSHLNVEALPMLTTVQLQRRQNASVIEQRCADLSPHSADRNHQFTPDPWRPSSPLCAGLGIRYTQARQISNGRDKTANPTSVAAAPFSSICVVDTAPQPCGARHECTYVIWPFHGGGRSVDWLEAAPAGVFG